MTLTEFLLARLADDEARARNCGYATGGGATPRPPTYCVSHSQPWGHEPDRRVLAEVEAKRRIVEWHKNWPVFTNTEPVFEQDIDLGSMTMQMSQKMAWLTEQEYRTRFGDEPPTGPILRFLASVYADHPDYDQAWAV